MFRAVVGMMIIFVMGDQRQIHAGQQAEDHRLNHNSEKLDRQQEFPKGNIDALT